jgi:hypothetical protein
MRKATADETGTVQSTDSRSDDKGRTKNQAGKSKRLRVYEVFVEDQEPCEKLL